MVTTGVELQVSEITTTQHDVLILIIIQFIELVNVQFTDNYTREVLGVPLISIASLNPNNQLKFTVMVLTLEGANISF